MYMRARPGLENSDSGSDGGGFFRFRTLRGAAYCGSLIFMISDGGL